MYEDGAEVKNLPYQYSLLLVALLAMIMLAPVIPSRLVVNLLLSGLLLFGVYAGAQRRPTLLVGSTLALADIAVSWVAYAQPQDTALAMWSQALDVVFFCFLAGTILSVVLRARRIEWETVAGALDVYLLAAVAWGALYGLLEVLDPGTLKGVDLAQGTQGTVYFSLVTITTLGYGDITPATGIARGVASVEAVVGQLYLVVLVARLVALYSAAEVEEETE